MDNDLADQRELFPYLPQGSCLRQELRTCLGPCAAACTRQAYQEKECGTVRRFLEGTDLRPLEILEQRMKQASASQEYERASLLRDKFDGHSLVASQVDQLRLMRQKIALLIYPVTGWAPADDLVSRQSWPSCSIAVPEPHDRNSHLAAISKLEKVYRPVRSQTILSKCLAIMISCYWTSGRAGLVPPLS